jgi:NAD-dependent SIR2 family protein deacetylase
LIDLVRRAASRDGGGVVIHTGAGVSTAAGVPDFRGPSGVWTMRDVGVDVAVPKFERVVPTKAHMAIAALVRAGVVKRVVTQNVDGLHARSGCDDDKVSRLHGCVYEETCVNERCEKFEFRVKRAFDVTAGKLSEGRMHRHRTGRACDACGEELRDTIVHFGERLHPPTLLAATRASADAALSVVVGTSLKVPPASTLPGKSRNRVICNLQWTRYDATAAMKIHARADEAMTRLCEGLGVEVPEYDARSDPVGAAFLASGGTFLLAGKKEEEEEEKEGGDASALAAGAGAGRGRAGAKKKKRRGRGSKPCVPRPTS